MKELEEYTNEELLEFDKFVEKTLINLYSTANKAKGHILFFRNFNPKDKSHLYLLEIANMARSFYGFDVIINCKWYQKLLCRKCWGFERSSNDSESGINIEEFLEFTKTDTDVNEKEIYELYYKERYK